MVGARVLAVLAGLPYAECSFDSAGLGATGAETSAGSADDTTGTPPLDTSTGTEPASTSSSASASTSSSHSGGEPTTTSSEVDASSSTGDDGPPELGPFGMPELVPGLGSDESDDDPTLRADLLEIYFASLRAGGQGSEDIWRAERDSTADDFGMPEPVVPLNAVGQDGWPELSHDGLVLTLGSDRPGGVGGFDIWVSTRGSVDADFGAAVLATDLSTGGDEASAVFSADLLEAFVCSPVALFADVRSATRADLGAQFGKTALVSTASSDGRDCVPFLDQSGTRILFASDRLGGMGGMDLYTGVRAGETDGDAFADVATLDALNSAVDDDDPWWAPDGSALYFSSARDGGDLDLFVAYRE